MDERAADRILAMIAAVYELFLEATIPIRAFLHSESSFSLRKLWLGEVAFLGLCRHEGYMLEFDRCPQTRRLRFTTCGIEISPTHATSAMN